MTQKTKHMESLSGSRGDGSGKAQTTGAEPGYMTGTRTTVKQGRGYLVSLQNER